MRETIHDYCQTSFICVHDCATHEHALWHAMYKVNGAAQQFFNYHASIHNHRGSAVSSPKLRAIYQEMQLEIAACAKHQDLDLELLMSAIELRHPIVMEALGAHMQPLLEIADKQYMLDQQLYDAVSKDCDVEKAKELIEAGADPLLQDGEGNTLLHVAARTGNISLAKILLANNNEKKD